MARTLQAVACAAIGSAVLVAAFVVLANLRVLSARELLGPTDSFEVAIVPGCHTTGLRPSPTLAARLAAALELYRSGRVPRILVTGNEQATETSAMRHWLEQRGVPERDILVDGTGTRTLLSMRHAADDFGVRRAVVCTQRLHMARALYLARATGIDAVGLEAAVDSDSPRLRVVEMLKRTLAFVETTWIGPAEPDLPVVASLN